jgi:hypothetical protein
VQVDLAAPCAAALPALTALEGVLTPSRVPAGTTSGAVRLEYRTIQPNRVNPRVIAQLAATGAEIVSVTCTTHTLEEVYAAAMSGEIDLVNAPAVGAVGGR